MDTDSIVEKIKKNGYYILKNYISINDCKNVIDHIKKKITIQYWRRW